MADIGEVNGLIDEAITALTDARSAVAASRETAVTAVALIRSAANAGGSSAGRGTEIAGHLDLQNENYDQLIGALTGDIERCESWKAYLLG